MSYDELVKDLREQCNKMTCGDCGTCVMRKAADAIEELRQIAGHYEECAKDYFKDVCYYLERAPKWIPVTERLPEPGVPCICWCKGGTFGQIRWYGLYYLTSHRTWAIYDNDYENQEVTHWMYRPEPPKEDKP